MVERPEGVDRRYMAQYARAFATGGDFEVDDGTRRVGRQRNGAKRGAKTLAVLRGQGAMEPSGVASREAELVVRLGREPMGEGTGRPRVLLKLLLIEGTLFVQCELPSPALFGVVPSMSGGNPMMRLEPVV